MLCVVIGSTATNGGAYREFSAVTCGSASPPARIDKRPARQSLSSVAAHTCAGASGSGARLRLVLSLEFLRPISAVGNVQSQT
jgi:hypothetical protein